MDPQQRILLELAWACFEDAGIAPKATAGRNVGVFIGACNYDYKEIQDRHASTIEGHFLSGTACAILANRLSHFFDFHGPSLAIDAACASSLFAIHAALRSLREGECEMALAGGINVLASGERFVPFAKLGMLSQTGRCHSFDAAADGYVRAEGAGLLLLKPLARAIRDRDLVYGLIKSSAINHGGRAPTLTSPNAFSQSSVIASAWKRAGVPMETAGYIEAHGTGTPLGDPIEMAGLRRAFGQLAKEGLGSTPRCGIGTIKANIGHAEGAAGIAGVIKVLLAMRHAMLPGLAGFRTLNPRIKVEGTPFFIVERTAPWVQPVDANGVPQPRRAGVSSFGFGGANAHVVLEEFVGRAPCRLPTRGPVVVPLSAKTPEQLREMAARLAQFSSAPEPDLTLEDVALTLQTGRDAMACRVAVIASSLPELAERLEAFARGEPLRVEAKGRSRHRPPGRC